jgi:hypothetical protein
LVQENTRRAADKEEEWCREANTWRNVFVDPDFDEEE